MLRIGAIFVVVCMVLIAGSVGATIAYASLIRGVAKHIGLYDVNRAKVEAEVTEVEFAALTEEEIAAYVAQGEPMDKAGAYAIQGRASRWVPRIRGCYFNVVGLPVARVCRMLRRAETE